MALPLIAITSTVLAILSDDEEDRGSVEKAFERAALSRQASFFIDWFQNYEDAEPGDLTSRIKGRELCARLLGRYVQNAILSASSLDEMLPALNWLEELVLAWNERWYDARGHRAVVLESYSLVAPALALYPHYVKLSAFLDANFDKNYEGVYLSRFRGAPQLPSFGGRPILSIAHFRPEIDAYLGETLRADRHETYKSIEEEAGADFCFYRGEGDSFPIFSFDEDRVLIRSLRSSSRAKLFRVGEWRIAPRPTPEDTYDTYFRDLDEG